MPIFCLRPVKALLDDPAWRSTPIIGPVWVNAADESEARALAAGRYQDARADLPGEYASASPWQDARLVEAAPDAPPTGLTIPPGVVVGERQM